MFFLSLYVCMYFGIRAPAHKAIDSIQVLVQTIWNEIRSFTKHKNIVMEVIPIPMTPAFSIWNCELHTSLQGSIFMSSDITFRNIPICYFGIKVHGNQSRRGWVGDE